MEVGQTDIADNPSSMRAQVAQGLKRAVRLTRGTAQIAEVTGIPKRTLDAYVANETSIPTDRLLTVASALLQLNPAAAAELQKALVFSRVSDLMQEREMVASPYRTTRSGAPRVEEERTPYGCARIPLYRNLLSAGNGELAIDNEIIGTRLFDLDWLNRTIGAPLEMLSLWVARGDSMGNTIHDGDLLLIDRSDTAPKRDDIYALLIDGEQYVKRLQRRLDRSIDVISDNSAYNTQTLSMDDSDQREVKIYGHVAWWAHTNRR
jgi:phage repressor protein C with HTH and peptisase S24 domain